MLFLVLATEFCLALLFKHKTDLLLYFSMKKNLNRFFSRWSPRAFLQVSEGLQFEGQGYHMVCEALPSYWKVAFPFTIIFCSCKEQKAHRVSLGQLP